MKDITTVCTQDEGMAPGRMSGLSSPVHKPPTLAPEATCSNSSYSNNPPSPTAYSAAASPSVNFALSLSTSFCPSPAATLGNFVPPASSSRSFIPSPSSGTGFVPHSPSAACIPSPSMSFTPSPSTSFSPEASPSASLSSPLSPTESVKSEGPLVSLPMSRQSQQPKPLPTRSMGPKSSSSARSSPYPVVTVKQERAVSPGMTVSGNLLPPCRICLDKASGFHYGLNTCEACKGFFRRSLKRGASYVCTREGKCDVTGERRNLCGYCRYQKCVSLGMSKTAIKTGRYTHAKRTRDTLEIKKLMQADSNEEEDIDFDALISKIVSAHDDFILCSTRVPMETILKRQRDKVEEMRIRKELYGKMVVSEHQYQDIYRTTGLDIDNRKEMMDFHVRNSEKWIRGYITFAKQVPGFRDLSPRDQANLVKYARIEVWFLGSYPGYSSEKNVAVMPNGRSFAREEMETVWKTKYIDVSFELSQKLQKLKVTPEEIIIVKTICLTAGDRCTFEEPEKVAQMQWLMVRCLEHLLQRSHSSHAERVITLGKIISCLTDLRDLNEAEYQTIQNTQLYEKFQSNPLIIEMLPY